MLETNWLDLKSLSHGSPDVGVPEKAKELGHNPDESTIEKVLAIEPLSPGLGQGRTCSYKMTRRLRRLWIIAVSAYSIWNNFGFKGVVFQVKAVASDELRQNAHSYPVTML